MNKRLIKFLTFAFFLITANPVFSQTEIQNDSLWNKNYVLTKKEIQASAKTGLYSLLLTQPGFIQNKKSMTFRGLSWNYTKIELDGLDIKDPFSGELAFDPVLQTLDIITINDSYASGEVSLNSNQDFSVLRSSAGYLFDGFDPGKNTRGMQSIYATVSGPVLNWQSLSFAATAKRTSSKSLWLNGESVAEFWDGVGVNNIPMSHQEFNVQSNNYDQINDIVNISYPTFRNGAERTQYDFSGNLNYENEIFRIKYQILGQTALGRMGITPSNIFALENRPQFEQNSQLHQLTFSQYLTDQLKYTISGSYFSKYYSEFDPNFKDNVLAYGDPDKNPNFIYGSDGNIWRKKTNYNSFGDFSFSNESDMISGFVKRKQNYFEIKGKAQYQYDEQFNFEIGFKNRDYEVRYLAFNPNRLKSIQNDFQKNVVNNPDIYKPNDFLKYAARAIGADNYGFDVLGNETDDDYAKSRKPAELKIWGKTEFNSEVLKLDAQIGFQKLNVGGIKLKSKFSSGDYGYISINSFSETEDESNILYNLGMTVPILENLTFFGNICRENILPPAADNNLGIAVMSKIISGGNAFSTPIPNNPKSIEARTINIGMSFSFEELLFVTGKFFIQDIKNLFQIRIITTIVDLNNFSFYGITQDGEEFKKGIEGQVKTARWNYLMVTGKLNLSFDVNGGSSSPISQFRTVWLDPSNTYAPSSQPLTSNEIEYQYNAGIDFHVNQDHELIDELNEFGFNFSVQGNSGYPYTRHSGYTSISSRPTESINSSKTPNFITYDLSCDIGFSFISLNGLVYIKVENLTNKKVVLDVFGQTGSAENDGYLNTEGGKKIVANSGPKYAELYNALNNQNHPEFFGSPRTVTFGVKLDF